MSAVRRRWIASTVAMGIAAACEAQTPAPPIKATDWEVAGSLGMLTFVVVTEARATDRALYDEVIKAYCTLDSTCFLRFFTNSKKRPLGMPLDDAILVEPAAMFQRSGKQGNAVFMWSCRLKQPVANCF